MPASVETPSAARRALTGAGLGLLLAGAVVGGDLFGARDALFGTATGPPRAAATGFTAVPSSAPRRETVLRSQPWWQAVRELRGSGPRTADLPIADAAIQWRAEWACTSGRLVVQAGAQPLIDATCPAKGTAQSTRPGPTRLEVRSGTGWTLDVDQQVDVPLDEPPMAGMGTRPRARGGLYRIDQAATGDVRLHRLPGGSYALRLEDFFITPNVDLELRLSPLARPRSTKAFLSAPSVLVAPLPITTGSLNFRVPRGIDPTRYKSLVVWCPPTRNAYGAAPLQ